MRELLLRALAAVAAGVFRAAERSPAVRDRVLRPATFAFVEHAIRAWRRSGPAAWDRWHLPLAAALGRHRAAYLRDRLDLDPENARSLGSVHDYEDPLLGIGGHWAQEGRERAVRVETDCPIGRRLRAHGCADFCRVIVHAFERETLQAVSPGYRLEPLEELISAGDERCTFIHHLPARREPR